MSSSPAFGRAELACLMLLLALASVLAFANLDAQVLWQDEAQSALLARSTLEHGIPLGSDGRNSFSQEFGAETDGEGRWRWHTWLHFYLVAASFAILGEGTWAARLPGALAGVASVALCFWTARTLFRSRFAALLSGALLLLQIPFWILARQCRYYSLTALATLAVVVSALWVLQGRRGATPFFVVATLCLFHAHYVYVPPFLLALGIYAWIWERAAMRRLLVAMASALLLCAPWILWQSGMDYAANYAAELSDPAWWFRNAALFCAKGLRHATTPLLFALCAAALLWCAFVAKRTEGAPRLRHAPGLGLLVTSIATTLATLSIAAPDAFFRYLAPLLPLCVMAMAGAVDELAQWLGRGHAPDGFAPRTLLLGFAALFVFGAAQPLRAFGHELRSDFHGPLEALAGFLNERAAAQDVLLITYGDLPMKFYTPLRVLGGLTGEDLSEARDARWVVLRHHTIHPDRDGRVAAFIRDELELDRYRKIELPFADTPFENREEPDEHRFRSARGGAPLVVYERRP